MPEPKKRTNKSKAGMRRMKIRAKMPAISYCENCHQPLLNHKVCENCGFYNGKKVIDKDFKKEIIEEK